MKLAEARSSEYHSTWGVAGNQEYRTDLADGELREREITDDFDLLFRWLDRSKAKEAADLAHRIVQNPLVGYSQCNGDSPRTTLYDELEKADWNPDKLTIAVNTDCSAMMAAVVTGSGVRVSKDMYTGNEESILDGTGAFEKMTITGTKPAYTVGDILLRQGHTAIVVDVPSGETMTVSNCKSVNMRNYVGTPAATPLQVLKAGDVVELTGESVTWYKCTCKGKTGWVSGKYLE